MSSRDRFHITDTDTYNDTGLRVIDHPEQIAVFAKTHVVVIDFEDCPEYRPDLYVSRIVRRIRKACKKIGLPVTIQSPGRTRRVTVRRLDPGELGYRRAMST